ncbi:hypothetical protein DSAG12_03225 [Promethearchaeum syntrophicum]|uniref:Uncharacterized protein n=1 Tax=Promethearchaeum syntrophicum TaxID=2594042 RepID=A0A5B9DEG8_9ARCH|nr:hypothetical protein [Candidatus Prometheoarchaeum syntrophicum]QEE17391.1 hypothetical protein DSAG12_03225 [Candidatus Prometheoarchaeum syntrophicum]
MRKNKLFLCLLLVSILGISTFGNATAYNNRNVELSDEVYLIVSAEYPESEDDGPEDPPELLPNDEIIEFINATYYDIDGDGSEDDVLTDFIFRVPTGNFAFMRCDIYVELELPSTTTFYAYFRFFGAFSEVAFFLDWINVATEGGDYIFTVVIDYVGTDITGYPLSGIISDFIVFDPPVNGPIGGFPG